MNDLKTFVRVIETGSFAAAAAGLGLTPSAVSKTISRIEDRLHVRLLTRTTRRLAMTEEGRLYLERAREILHAIEAAEAEVASARNRPSGHLRVNTGTAYGRHQMTHLLPEFLARYPEITFDLTISDRQIDLIAENVDVAVRTGTLADSSLQAVKLTDGHRIICASPAYLERFGAPKVPGDLLGHNCLVVSHQAHLAEWPFITPEGINRLRVSGSFTADSADILLDFALAGQGIVRLGDVLVAPPIAKGLLVPLLEDTHANEPFPVWAVMPPGRFRLPRVRVFLDFLGEKLGPRASAAPQPHRK